MVWLNNDIKIYCLGIYPFKKAIKCFSAIYNIFFGLENMYRESTQRISMKNSPNSTVARTNVKLF